MATSDFYQYIFPNNLKNQPSDTNTDWSFQFPHNIELGVPFECAITESFIPFSAYNIPESETLIVAIFASVKQLTEYDTLRNKRKFKETILPRWRSVEKNVRVVTDVFQGPPMNEYAYAMETYKLHFAFKVKIQKGYYANIEEVLSTVKLRISRMLENHQQYEALHPNEDVLTDHLSEHYSFYIDDNVNQEEWYIGYRSEIKKSHFLNRIQHNSGQKKVIIQPSLKTEKTYSQLFIKKATANLFGWPDEIKLEVYPDSLIESPYQTRLSAFGDIIMIYTNIIENPVVKGFSTNLLKVITLETDKKFGQLCYFEFKNPTYVSLNSKYLSSFRVYLRDLAGNKILFENSSHPVMFNLHFRPVNQLNNYDR